MNCPHRVPVSTNIVRCRLLDDERIRISQSQVCGSCESQWEGGTAPTQPTPAVLYVIKLSESVRRDQAAATMQKVTHAAREVVGHRSDYLPNSTLRAATQRTTTLSEELRPRCEHLGAAQRRTPCGCWQKWTHRCNFFASLVVPSVDCQTCGEFQAEMSSESVF